MATASRTKVKHEVRLKEWDQWIREGHASKVRTLCRRLNHRKIPRSLLVDYAQIARRVGAPDLIVLWLRHIVRSEKPLAEQAHAAEKAIYGLGLLRLGAFREASQILSEVDPAVDPQVYFYRASLNMNQWNYARAISDLRKYARHPHIPTYSKLVGRLNLCAALVSGPGEKAAAFEIEKLMRILNRKNILLLKGNLLEIRSQWLYGQGRLDEALKDLEAAAAILSHADARSLLYVEKWRLIIQLKAGSDQNATLAKFETLKSTAVAINDWETVRDSDLHTALTLKDRDLILKVFWGSKFQAYKKRMRQRFGEFPIEPSFDWIIGNKIDAPRIDLVSAAPTKSLRELFFILTRDMYQPLRATEIIDTLYPNEYYHAAASPAKLHRLIARARQWLRSMEYPIMIEAHRSSFKLSFSGPCRFVLLSEMPPNSHVPLPEIAHQDFFTAQEWARAKDVSERTARHQIQHLTKAGFIKGIKRGSRTKYRLIRRY